MVHTPMNGLVFNSAVDKFFEMGPINTYWLPVAFFFAREKKINLIDNYTGNDTVLVRLDLKDLNDNELYNNWVNNGIQSRSAVISIPNEIKKEVRFLLDNGSEVSEYLKTIGKRMDSLVLFEVIDRLLSLDTDWYEYNSLEAFGTIISKCTNSERGLLINPKELTETICSIAKIKEYSSVYLPYTKVGEYSQGFKSEVSTHPTIIGCSRAFNPIDA